MPHKHNADRRHHIPKMSFKVRNWAGYEAGLRRRGSLTLWIEDAALECWQTIGPSGQGRYTNAAIQTSLMLRAAFKLALRQIEGLMTSVLSLMGLTISAPDHTTVSRRATTLPVIPATSVPLGPLHVLIDSTGLQVYGAGQWLEAKHGAKSRRKWRKLHLAVDAASGMIVAQTLTDQETDDPCQVAPLLDQIDDPIGQVTADGAYDGAPTYQTIAQHGDGMRHFPRPNRVACGTLRRRHTMGRWCTWPVRAEMAPNSKRLRDDRLATDGIRASGRQHPVQHSHADGSLGLLTCETAGSQPRSDQQLVTAHCRFD